MRPSSRLLRHAQFGWASTIEMAGPAKFRYPAAPEPVLGEAPSFWLCRVAHAHGMTMNELIRFHSAGASQIDSGHCENLIADIARSAPCHEWPSPSAVVVGLNEIGLAGHPAQTISTEDWWAYCPACLCSTTSSAPYFVASDWCQPFAFVCLEHATYLRPWPKDHEVRWADGRTGFKPFEPPWLEAELASDADLEFGRQLLSPHRGDWERLAYAVFDLVDALCARTGPNGSSPPLLRELVGLERGGNHIGAVRLPKGVAWELPSHTRIHVLKSLSQMVGYQPACGEPPADWLRSLARRPGGSSARDLYGATNDPLILVLARLNSTAAVQLAHRADRWPASQRIRLGAAVIVAAIAGCP